ncbi:MAG: hypothetical protein K0S01_3309 [Herbinix sp.]|jgi:uncharacterized 2Fe-2S/4Fe-4S cluster protein (DUF4445 family)|nr:hypothetical protein [Herbinix sp.]
MDKRYQIEIQQLHNTFQTITCSDNENLLDAMIRQSIPCRSDCGGRGTCGKCKIQVIKGDLDITSQDHHIFTNEELQKGYRLSCKAYPRGDISIKPIVGKEADIEVVTESIRVSPIDIVSVEEESYAIAIDLGTTTVAISIIDRKDGSIVNTHAVINPQRVYGADVISRIMASNEGKKEELRKAIGNCILEGILSVIKDTGITANKIWKIAIAGNTTMGHLLLGYSCETLGVFPFTPVNIGMIEIKLKDIISTSIVQNGINDSLNINMLSNIERRLNLVDVEFVNTLQEVPVVLLPGISTFVGGDIVAGLSFCGYYTNKKPCLLIDLGTNGEMALGNQERILVTSTAAGPAFEGGNITFGMGSVPGAISSISIRGKEVTVGTIGNKPAIGICGTGVVEVTSELFKAGLIDDTGLLVDEYFKDGFPILRQVGEEVLVESNNSQQDQNSAGTEIQFTQKDIRELQLAKAAIRAGLEILIKNYGITQEEINKVYLAGGFGFKLNIDKAIHIGLLPEEFRDKVIVIGNSSLAGVIEFLTVSDSKEKMERIISISDEIHLSNDDDFYDLYLKYMSF